VLWCRYYSTTGEASPLYWALYHAELEPLPYNLTTPTGSPVTRIVPKVSRG
jgi:hypothetical protein